MGTSLKTRFGVEWANTVLRLAAALAFALFLRPDCWRTWLQEFSDAVRLRLLSCGLHEEHSQSAVPSHDVAKRRPNVLAIVQSSTSVASLGDSGCAFCGFDCSAAPRNTCWMCHKRSSKISQTAYLQFPVDLCKPLIPVALQLVAPVPPE